MTPTGMRSPGAVPTLQPCGSDLPRVPFRLFVQMTHDRPSPLLVRAREMGFAARTAVADVLDDTSARMPVRSPPQPPGRQREERYSRHDQQADPHSVEQLQPPRHAAHRRRENPLKFAKATRQTQRTAENVAPKAPHRSANGRA